jgi:fibronectin-binding autotransporter adhesin
MGRPGNVGRSAWRISGSRPRFNRRKVAAALFVAGGCSIQSICHETAQANSTYTWSSGTGSAWLTNTNWSPSSPSTGPGIGDVAYFTTNPTSGTASGGVGVNFKNLTNYGATTFNGSEGALDIEGVGAIWVSSTRTNALFIGNSQGADSTHPGGYMQFNGATVNGVADTILYDADTGGSLSIQNQVGSGSLNTLGMILGDSTSNVVQIAAGGTINISSTIDQAGSGYSLTLMGNGTSATTGGMLVLGSTTNTFTGGMTVGSSASQAAVLQIATAAALPVSGNTTVNTNSQLLLTGAGSYYGSLTLNGPGTTANGGALRITAANATLNGTTTLGSNTEIDVTSTNVGTLSGTVSDGGYQISKQGAGTLNLASASNVMSGSTTIGNGAVVVASGSSMGTATLTLGQTSTSNTSLVLNNASQTVSNLTTNWAATSGTVSQNINLSSTALTINQTSPTTYGNGIVPTLTGTITGGGSVTLSSSSTSTLTLSGMNSYTGTTNVNGGTLNVTGGLGNTNVTLSAPMGATGSTPTLASGIGSVGIGGRVTLNSNTAIAPGGSGLGTLAAASLNVNGGTLSFNLSGNTSSLIATTGALTLGSNAVGTIDLVGSSFNLNGTFVLLQFGSLSLGSGTLELGSMPTTASEIYTLNIPAGTGAGSITVTASSQMGNLVWSPNAYPSDGGGTWTDGGGNFYDTNAGMMTTWSNSGSSNVTFGSGGNGGTVSLGSPIIVAGMLTFAPVASPYTIGVLGDSTNTLTLNGGLIANAPAAIDAAVILGQGSNVWDVAGGSTLSVGGTISDNGSAQTLIKTDSGTLVFSASNSYSGGTAINGGVLSITADNNLGASAGTLSISGGTLETAGAVSSPRTITLTGAATVNTDGFGSTFSGPIGGSAGSLTVTGGGSLTLTASNSYAGGTTISGAAVNISNDNQLGSGNVTFSGGTLAVSNGVTSSKALSVASSANGFFDTGGLSSSYSALNGSGTLTVGGTSSGALALGTIATTANLTVSNGINVTDSAAYAPTTGFLTVNSGGTFTISNSSTSGLVGGTINGGLVLGSAARLNVSSLTVSGSGSVQLPVNLSNISNSGSASAGALDVNVVLNSSNSTGAGFTGGDVTVASYSPGNFITGIGGTAGSTTSPLVLGGVISGYSDVNVSNSATTGGGSGSVAFDAQNTWAGATTINGNNATIFLGVANALPRNTDVIYGTKSGTGLAMLDLDGNNQQFASLSNGTVSISATKVLTILDGVATPATLTIGGSDTPANPFVGVIKDGTGTVSLVKSGAGFLELGNLSSVSAYSYSGGTTVSAGTLQVTGAALTGAGSINVTQTGFMQISGGGTYSGNGGINVSGVEFLASGGSALTGSGSINVSNHALMVVSGGGTISGGGAVNVNGGEIELTGGSAISGGGAVNVSGGGTFGANGTVSGPLTVGDGSTGATLFPGTAGSIGSLSLANTGTLNSDAVLSIRIAQPASASGGAGNGKEGSDNDTIVVSGSNTLHLLNATLQVIPTGTFAPTSGLGYTYTIVDAGSNGAVSGTFANLADAVATQASSSTFTEGGFSYSVSYGTDEITLDVTSVPEPGCVGMLCVGSLTLLRHRRRAGRALASSI